MMIDQELFDLCKQVYEATGWPQELNISQLYEYWDDHDELCVISIEDSDDELVPSYTSDYLLEKLPPTVVARGESFSTATRVKANAPIIGEESDTPLKALLKLCLALKEAGELK